MKIKILLLIAVFGLGFYLLQAKAQDISSSTQIDVSLVDASSSLATSSTTTVLSSDNASSSSVASSSTSTADIVASSSSSNCDLSDDLNKLSEIEKDSANLSKDKLNEDLQIRRDILTKSLNCEIDNINVLKSDLANLKPTSDKLARLKSQYLKNLNDIISFYNSKKSQVNKLKIAGTKQLSEEILKKKQDDFNIQTQLIIDFVLWAKNQDILSSLSNNIQDVNRYLKIWSLFDKDVINSNFKSSQSDLNMAQEISSEIEDSFSSSTISVSQVNDLTKSFLQSIYNTYQDLINLQSNIKKILP